MDMPPLMPDYMGEAPCDKCLAKELCRISGEECGDYKHYLKTGKTRREKRYEFSGK